MSITMALRSEASAPELRALLRLSWPLVLGFAGGQLMSLVDTAMVGRLGSVQLGGVSVGIAVFMISTIFGMGCVLGMDPLVSQAVGANEPGRAHQVLRAGVRLALLLTIPLALISVLGVLVLDVAGVDAAVAASARAYLWGRLPGIAPFLLFAAYRSYLQANDAGRPIVIAMVVSNVMNVIANALLIFGDESLSYVGLPGVGLPALGVMGAGLASTLATIMSVVVGVLAVRAVDPQNDAPSDPNSLEVPSARLVMRLGLPIGLTMLAEVGAFALSSFLAGALSPTAVAGHQVAITLASFSFTVSLGIASATCVRVGRAVGQKNAPLARTAGFAGLFASGIFMLTSAVVFLAAPELLARTMTDRPEVIAAAVPLIRIAAVFQLFDGTQAVMAGALRGIGDTQFIQWANYLGYYALGMPVGYLLAFPMGWGVRGLWWGLCIGLTAVGVALTARFTQLSRGNLDRVGQAV